ncbi:MAG: hypothetical protein QOG58_4320, partial [Caballeronia sp.]|nr:hypothetical protein [Caballeronia sp.]
RASSIFSPVRTGAFIESFRIDMLRITDLLNNRSAYVIAHSNIRMPRTQYASAQSMMGKFCLFSA